MPRAEPLRTTPASAFARAAGAYWLDVYPRASRELHRWRTRASSIPDPRLRALACETLRTERGNLEGAAAFATLAPRGARTPVVRAAVAFQTAYDFLDTLTERPCAQPMANGSRLHLALAGVFVAHDARLDYYAYGEWAGSAADGGYLRDLIATARAAFAGLPSHAVVAPAALAATRRMAGYQALCHAGPARVERLRAWARALPAARELSWWEAAAGAASSLPVFALFAAAARPGLGACEAQRIERAYHPWIGALHVLLDSLADRPSDLAGGHLSLLGCYGPPAHAARELGVLARRARGAALSLADAPRHAVLLEAMAGLYLSSPGALLPEALPCRGAVVDALGGSVRASVAVHNARTLTARAGAASARRLGGGRALRPGPRGVGRRGRGGEARQHQLQSSAALRG